MDINMIYEYESILLGKKSGFSSFFFNHSDEANERSALELFDYVVKTYLRWTPEQVYNCMSWDIINRLKLDTIMRYIRFPPEMDVRTDLYVIASKLYPDKIKINSREMTLLVYKRVLSGELYKFPKGFFLQNRGINRAIICFQYMLGQYTAFSSVEEMYEFFSTPKGTKLLKQYKLNAVSVAIYEYPIDYLHASLPPEVKSQFYYNYYRFKLSNNEQIRNMKKNNTFIA